MQQLCLHSLSHSYMTIRIRHTPIFLSMKRYYHIAVFIYSPIDPATHSDHDPSIQPGLTSTVYCLSRKSLQLSATSANHPCSHVSIQPYSVNSAIRLFSQLFFQPSIINSAIYLVSHLSVKAIHLINHIPIQPRIHLPVQ